MNDIDALLRRYDAAPEESLSPAETARAELLLTRITQDRSTQPQFTQAAATNSFRATGRRRRGRRRLVLGVAGLAAAALVIGGVTAGSRIEHRLSGQSSSGLTQTELADWTAAPGHPAVTSPVVRQVAAECLSSLGISSPAGAAALISNVDERGRVITLVATAADSRQRGFCLATASSVVLAELVDTPGAPLPALGAGAVNVQSEESHGSGPAAISLAWGQAGPGATGLALTTAAGETITATVQHGLWTLWWPPKDASTGDLSGGTVTWTAGGTRHSAPAESLYANP
jgi:hypothetical protein